MGSVKDNTLALCLVGNLCTDKKIIGNHFVKFFTDKVKTLGNITDWPTYPELREVTNPLQFTAKELNKALKKVKNKKCYGPNGIPLKIAKDVCNSFKSEMLNLFNSYT